MPQSETLWADILSSLEIEILGSFDRLRSQFKSAEGVQLIDETETRFREFLNDERKEAEA